MPTGRTDFISVGKHEILFSYDLFWVLMILMLMCNEQEQPHHHMEGGQIDGQAGTSFQIGHSGVGVG